MGRSHFISVVFCAVSLLFLVTPCTADAQSRLKDPPADPSDIVGYRYDSNWWELGADIDDVELKGFRPEETSDSDIEVYSDAEHPIWFGRDKENAYITIVFVKEVLGAIIIRLDNGGEDYHYYNQYYAKRFTMCTQIENSTDRNSWLDNDDDTVTVENQPYYFGCPSVPSDTVIVYLRRHVIQPNPAGSMPQWLYNLIQGLSFFWDEEDLNEGLSESEKTWLR
jgi:hypothetical protein